MSKFLCVSLSTLALLANSCATDDKAPAPTPSPNTSTETAPTKGSASTNYAHYQYSGDALVKYYEELLQHTYSWNGDLDTPLQSLNVTAQDLLNLNNLKPRGDLSTVITVENFLDLMYSLPQ